MATDIQPGGMLDRTRLTDNSTSDEGQSYQPKKRKYVNPTYKPLGTGKQYPGDRIDIRPDPGKEYKPAGQGQGTDPATGKKTVNGIVIEDKPIAKNTRRYVK